MNGDLISRSALCEKLQAHKDFFVNAWGGFGNLPPKDKARVDELTHCIAETMNAPAVDAETVFEAVGLVKEAFEMAKADLQPVVRCKDCKHSRERNENEKKYLVDSVVICTHPDCSADCWFATWADHWCRCGERRADK